MNYEKLKQDAQEIRMNDEAKRAITARLLAADTAPKRAPLLRALPAAAVLLVAVGAGILLRYVGATAPAVTPNAPETTLAAATDAQNVTTPALTPEDPARPTNEAPQPPQTEPGTEEPAAQTDTAPVQQGSANDAANESVAGYPADMQGNLWCLGPGETAPPMPTLIRSFPGYEPVKYYAPMGSYVLSPALSAAIEKYGDDPMTHYYLRITVLDENGANRTPDEWEAFYMREIERMWTPEDVDGEFSVLRSYDGKGNTNVEFALYLRDPSFLLNFPASPDYGYIIELFDEQNGVK